MRYRRTRLTGLVILIAALAVATALARSSSRAEHDGKGDPDRDVAALRIGATHSVTATITTNANSQGTIGLLLGLTTLPAATVNQGSMTIQ